MAEAECRNAALIGQSLPAFQNASSDRNSDISYLVSGIWQRRRRLRIPSAALSEDRVSHQRQTGADPPSGLLQAPGLAGTDCDPDP